ncbi:MAG: hypothetical protein PCFJNLEI_04173 [Verrucomicrobiae bacterium]|nr:hypothetical protein [Verrucomicrobiae bacterium]
MRALLLLLVSAGIASAQISVQLRAAKDTFLVYESIPVTVTIRNFSGRAIQLENSDATSWLRFVVTDENNQNVSVTAEFVAGESVLIPAGQTVSRVVDILPYYDLRRRGNYRVQVSVTSGGVVASSTPASLAIINGRELWTQTVGLPVVEGVPEEYRIYTLIARREGDRDQLYVSVRGEPSKTIFSLVPLGPCIAPTGLQGRIDQEAHLHVLFQNGPRSYGYVRIDPAARLATRAAYSDYTSLPELQVRENSIVVVGGEQTYPRQERLMTDEELEPPPPPPAPAPKKKWWWPFGAKRVPGEG